MEDCLNFGLFNLKEFVGWTVRSVVNYFESKGWLYLDSFNDYTWILVNHSLIKHITIKTMLSDEGMEIVTDIGLFNGIPSNSISEEDMKIFLDNFRKEIDFSGLYKLQEKNRKP